MKEAVQKLLDSADIKINGIRPWDIKVHDERFYSRVLAGGSLALGESYMDGWWDAEAVDQLIEHILNAKLDEQVTGKIMWHALRARLMNQQGKSRAKIVGEKHYDVGNELFKKMLDKRMIYSCGYWKLAKTLDQAQEAKLDLICKKLKLKPGMRLLDIGCGWGGLAKYAAEKYKVKVVGITISKEQVVLARENCKENKGKNLDIDMRLQDYRSVNEKFDRIVSVGMIEHVGYKNYREYMRVAHRCLNDEGLFLLHTIGGNKSTHTVESWIGKYIFPNGVLPSVKQLANAFEGLFIVEDWHSFGQDYDKTLMAWHANFNKHWNEIKADRYDERFKRMWNYYLLSCAGGFRARNIQLWQIVLTKVGTKTMYESIR